MIVLTGPSASGKTETAKYLMDHYGFSKVVTCTSRTPRVNEVNDVDYHFLTREQFAEGIENGEFLETAEYNGNMYGTKLADIGPDKVVCVEPRGARSYRAVLGDKMFCAYLDATEETRLNRMISIRKDGEKAARERIERDRIVFSEDFKQCQGIADVIFQTDGWSVEREAAEVFRAYQKWKAEIRGKKL